MGGLFSFFRDPTPVKTPPFSPYSERETWIPFSTDKEVFMRHKLKIGISRDAARGTVMACLLAPETAICSRIIILLGCLLQLPP